MKSRAIIFAVSLGFLSMTGEQPDAAVPSHAQEGETASTTAKASTTDTGAVDGGNGATKSGKGSKQAEVDDLSESSGALSRNSLCNDLKQTAKLQADVRSRLENEKASVQKERARLESILKEIEKARAELRAETKRLEQLMSKSARPQTTENEGSAETAQGGRPNSPTKSKPRRNAQEEWEGLAKTVKSMKPEQAAALLARTNKALTAEVLRRMKPADAGAIIEKFKPELAAEMLGSMVSSEEDPTSSNSKQKGK